MPEGLIYKIGALIKISGAYVCVSCGYRIRFNKEEIPPKSMIKIISILQ